jgi:hypothetical protein
MSTFGLVSREAASITPHDYEERAQPERLIGMTPSSGCDVAVFEGRPELLERIELSGGGRAGAGDPVVGPSFLFRVTSSDGLNAVIL